MGVPNKPGEAQVPVGQTFLSAADILVRSDRAGVMPGQECPGMAGKNACPTVKDPAARKNGHCVKLSSRKENEM
jgi:hypothetical protein